MTRIRFDGDGMTKPNYRDLGGVLERSRWQKCWGDAFRMTQQIDASSRVLCNQASVQAKMYSSFFRN